MKAFFDPKGLMCIALACLFLRDVDADFLVVCEVVFWTTFGLGGLVLCVLSGQIAKEEREGRGK